MYIVKGDGTYVTMKLTTVTGQPVEVRMPKLEARKFGEEVREASHNAEPTCNDPHAHWEGHCNCR